MRLKTRTALICSNFLFGSETQTALLENPSSFATFSRLCSLLRQLTVILAKVVISCSHIHYIIIQSVAPAAGCRSTFSHDHTLYLTFQKLDVLAIAHLHVRSVATCTGTTKVIELSHGVYTTSHVSRGRCGASSSASSTCRTSHRLCCWVVLSAKLARETNRLWAWRESLIVQECKDAFLAQKHLNDLFPLVSR